MNATTHSPFDAPLRRSGTRARGVVIVLALHLLAGWALLSGTAQRGVELLRKPSQMRMIQEAMIKPPPPPPPPKPRPQPKVAHTPPPYVPPPEQPVAQDAPTIESSPQPAPPPPAPAPPAPGPVVSAPPAPPAPPAKVDMGMVCPTQVAPQMPRQALIDGTQGVVRAQALVADGRIREVHLLSGPRVFYDAVRQAMLQYRCSPTAAPVLATQDFDFRVN